MSHKQAVLQRLSGLFRTRVILAVGGAAVIFFKPEIGEWVTILVGLALGVSAVDAFRVNNSGSNPNG